MSVTFTVEGVAVDYEDQTTYVNTAAHVAGAILQLVGLGDLDVTYGEHDVGDFAARLRRALWPSARHRIKPLVAEVGPSDRWTDCSARDQAFIELRMRQLLGLVEAATRRAQSPHIAVRWS